MISVVISVVATPIVPPDDMKIDGIALSYRASITVVAMVSSMMIMAYRGRRGRPDPGDGWRDETGRDGANRESIRRTG